MANTTDWARIAVRVPRELVEAFARLASANDRSVSGELRKLMRDHVSSAGEEVSPTSR